MVCGSSSCYFCSFQISCLECQNIGLPLIHFPYKCLLVVLSLPALFIISESSMSMNCSIAQCWLLGIQIPHREFLIELRLSVEIMVEQALMRTDGTIM